MKRDWLIRISVNNCGLDFEDDESLALLTTDANIEMAYVVQNALSEADKRLREEDKDGCCEYDEYGWNASVLLDEVCEKHGWTWSCLNPQVEFVID